MAILITGTNRKNTTGETARHSGTGGFLLWTETTLPVVQDLNTATGRTAMNLEGEPLPVGIVFIPLQVKTGDDASCLNLNQVSNPPLMAVPAALFDSLDAFSFNTLEPSIDPDHPWLGLEATGHENLINGFADMTVITWGLQKKIGDTLTFLDERGRPLLVRLAGGLENSIFQGNILIADRHFRRYYPSVSGARNILVDITPPAKASANNGDRVVVMQPNGGMADTLTVILENLLRDYGLMAQPATVRLASFNAVENTYLTVFMMLGGMGVIIGTIGLGIILRRNIQERKSELALLRAMGFRKRLIRRMLFTEYLKILLTGIALGFIPSLGVLLPKLLSPGYQLPLTWMGIILLLIILSGLAWIWFPVRRALNRDIVRGLREE
jgi:hypothetical protein